MILSLSSKVSIASTDGLLGLALIACKPELFPSGLTRQVLERARQAVRDGRGDPPKDVLACPGPLLADDAGDPELSGLEHALLFKKLPRPATKARAGSLSSRETAVLQVCSWRRKSA